MVTKVNAILNNVTVQLQESPQDRYSGILNAPKEAGEYDLSIAAHDDAGNVVLADQSNTGGMGLEVSKWHTPKVNWKPTDPVNIQDYNRIKGNLEWLSEEASILYGYFEIENMGSDKESYMEYYRAEEFNRFERNMEYVNQHIFTQNFGTSQQFFDNGPFITWTELKRLEGAILTMRDILERLKAGLPHLSVKIGNMKGVKV